MSPHAWPGSDEGGQGLLRSVRSSHSELEEETFAQKITPLAEKITEYINDYQDDAAQEDRWRTTMKRETMKRFREQRDEQREHVQKVETCFREQREAIAEVRHPAAGGCTRPPAIPQVEPGRVDNPPATPECREIRCAAEVRRPAAGGWTCPPATPQVGAVRADTPTHHAGMP